MTRFPLLRNARGRWPAAATALVLAVLGASAAGASSSTAQAAGCFPSGSRTLLRTDEARVYRVAAPRAGRGFQIYACAFEKARAIPLDDGDTDFAFLPPAMSLTGTTVGYASTSCDFSAGGNGCQTAVLVEDLSRDPADSIISRHWAGPRSGRPYTVGSLRAKPSGAVAWIQCPELTPQTSIRGHRGPTCVKPGNTDSVYKADAGTQKRVVLASGKQLDPSSLRRANSQITWTSSGGRTHRATLR